MVARLEFYGKLQDWVATNPESVELPSNISDTDDLRQWLSETRDWGSFIGDPSIRIAVNDEICEEPFPIAPSDRIAFLPPVGGG